MVRVVMAATFAHRAIGKEQICLGFKNLWEMARDFDQVKLAKTV